MCCWWVTTVQGWIPTLRVPCRACATAWRQLVEWSKRKRAPIRATVSGLSSRDLQQYRHELIDLAHLVEEVIGTSRHAAFTHGRKVVVGQHDDPHVAAIAIVAIAGGAARITPMPLPGRSSTSTTMAS